MKELLRNFKTLLEVLSGKAPIYEEQVFTKEVGITRQERLLKTCVNTTAFPQSTTMYYHKILSDVIYDKPEHLAMLPGRPNKYSIEQLPDEGFLEIFKTSGLTAISTIFNSLTV